MRNFVLLSILCAMLLVSVGCVVTGSPLAGSLYTDVKGPVIPTDNSVKPVKTGVAEATGILGFCTGDASIEAAMKQGNITKIHHVDMHATNVLAIFGKYKTVVYGE